MHKHFIGRINNRDTEVSFDGEALSTDGGLFLLDKIDKKVGLIEKIASNIHDSRDTGRIKHTTENMMRQRVYALASGNEDINDHQTIKEDPLYQAMLNTEESLASPSTICRFEKDMPLSVHFESHKALVETFINSYDKVPEAITLDFDPTDFTLYGDQESKHYHGYYGDYCYLPLIVTCGHQLLVAHLRPSNIDGARHVWAILALLVKAIRNAWPNIEITFRADSGLCRHRIFNWCEKQNIKYIVGLPSNAKLKKEVEDLSKEVESTYNKIGEKQKEFAEIKYKAGTWKCERRVVAKAEYNALGANNRFIVTNIYEHNAQFLYDEVYCARGDMENRIKEYQTDMFGSRMSCSAYAANQFRMLLSAIAYVYMNELRHVIHEEDQPIPYCNTVRLKLIKVAVTIRKNTRKLYLQISKSYPYKKMFIKALNLLVPT
jgi:hypothetical protein